jgi:hypothetical protein
MEFRIFLPKGVNPFKIQIRFKLEFASKIYNARSRDILELGQKENLSTLN